MPGSKRNLAQRAHHRERIAEMRLKSIPVSQIARKLRISDSTVNRELAILAKQWKAQAEATIDIHRQRELARLELIEREAFAEWERSKKNYSKEVTERLKVTDKDSGEITETDPKVIKRETGGRLGDPRLLQVALAAQEARRKMLGMDAPTKVAPTDPTGTKPYEKMGDDEILKRIAELQAKAA